MKGTFRLAGNRLRLSAWALVLFGACSGANTEPPDALLDEPRDAMAVPVRDQGRPSGDMTGAHGPLVINEVAPHGTDPDTDPDFIELYNAGSGQVNLRGYKVRDDSGQWTALPDGDVIPAGGYYIINCDDMSEASKLPGAHVGFKLGGTSDEAHLAAPDGTELDSVRWGSGAIEIPKGQSIGRKPDAGGPFVIFEKPTRGKPNS
ncbi:MAG: lamin tail domain-containing protein [Polyangia bacterium]